MKKILPLLLLAFCLCQETFAQENNTALPTITHYVFNNFMPGVVKKKSNQEVHRLLNYNTLTEEMVFIDDTQKFAMTSLEQIDTVYVGGKTFVPVNNMFYEKLTNTPVALYVRRKTNVLKEGKDIGYGAKSESGAISSVGYLVGWSSVYQLTLPQGYKLVEHSIYFIHKDGMFIQLNSVKKAQSAFPAKANAIKNFVAQNNIQFNNAEHMAKLVEFCNQP